MEANTFEKEVAGLSVESEIIGEREERYRVLFESIPASLYVIDVDGFITDVNPFHVARMGRERASGQSRTRSTSCRKQTYDAEGISTQFSVLERIFRDPNRSAPPTNLSIWAG